MKSLLRILRNADAGGVSGGDTPASVPDTSSSQQSVGATTPEPGGQWAWTQSDGGFSEGWTEHLPEQLRGHASLKTINSLPDLAKSYVETKAMIGKKFEAPGKDATPEQIAAWRRVVGAPEKTDGYYANTRSYRPDSVPENMWDAESEKRFLAVAHAHHLPPAAVKDILNFYGESVSQGFKISQQRHTAHLQEETASLRRTWGREYDANLSAAARVARIVGLDPKTHPIFTSSEVVQAFARMGKLMSEDRLVTGANQGISGSASDRIRDITDPKSNSLLAREYRGEFGPQRQSAAQTQYHQLLQSTSSY